MWKWNLEATSGASNQWLRRLWHSADQARRPHCSSRPIPGCLVVMPGPSRVLSVSAPSSSTRTKPDQLDERRARFNREGDLARSGAREDTGRSGAEIGEINVGAATMDRERR